MKTELRGNCYVASEAVYHLSGGAAGPWRPEYVHVDGEVHWYLRNRSTGEVLDLTVSQFPRGVRPSYHLGRGCGFLTEKPSARAVELMTVLVWGLTPTLRRDKVRTSSRRAK